MKRCDAAVRAVAIATATTHHVTGGYAGQDVGRTAAIGEWQGIQVVGSSARIGEVDLPSVPICDAGNMRQALCQAGHGIGDLDQRVFSFVNHDDIDFGMMGQQ